MLCVSLCRYHARVVPFLAGTLSAADVAALDRLLVSVVMVVCVASSRARLESCACRFFVLFVLFFCGECSVNI